MMRVIVSQFYKVWDLAGFFFHNICPFSKYTVPFWCTLIKWHCGKLSLDVEQWKYVLKIVSVYHTWIHHRSILPFIYVYYYDFIIVILQISLHRKKACFVFIYEDQARSEIPHDTEVSVSNLLHWPVAPGSLEFPLLRVGATNIIFYSNPCII